jgi:tetratricopeptide (TPR) repeat protein
MAYLRLGNVESALPLLEKGHKVCRSTKVQFVFPYAVGSLGYAYLLANEPKRALTVLEEGTKPDSLEGGLWITHPYTALADAYRAVGEVALAIETASRALKLADEREERGFEAWAMLVMAGINADAGRKGEAKQWYQRALQQASDLSMRPLVAHCHKGLSSIYISHGQKKEAQAEIKKAHEIYRSLGMNYWLQS